MPKSSSLLPLCFASLALGAVALTTTVAQAKTSWVVFDADTGRILGQGDANLQRAPASLAKMMTLYLAFEALKTGKLHWDEPMPVSKNAASKVRMKLGLRPGSTLTVRDAINSMIVISANDAATVMGEYLAGTEKGFGRLMTQRARKLGMKSTFFVNPSGLTASQTQLTTARDMAVLGMALRRDFPEYYHLFSQRSTEVQGRPLNGHNNLMYRYQGVDGIKTGYTDVSGYNLVSSAILNNRHLVGVVLGAGSSRERDNQMAKLLTKYSTETEGTGELLATDNQPVASITRQEAGQVPIAAMPAAPVAAAHVLARISEGGEGAATLAAATETPVLAWANPGNDVMPDDSIEQGDGGLPVATGRSAWRIQVGVASTEAKARSMQEAYADIVQKIVPGAKGEITQQRGRKRLFNVRYSGLRDQQAAANACSKLKQHDIDCLPIKG